MKSALWKRSSSLTAPSMRGTLNLPGTFWCVVSGGRLPMSAPTFKGGNVHCCAGRLTTSCLTKGLWMWSGGPGSQVPLIWKFLYIQCTMYMLCILMIDEIANADCGYHWRPNLHQQGYTQCSPLYPLFEYVLYMKFKSVLWCTTDTIPTFSYQ